MTPIPYGVAQVPVPFETMPEAGSCMVLSWSARLRVSQEEKAIQTIAGSA
ncbi:MAG TPA: hypothetical protein VNM24_06425 [Burkholderiales bacterium]|nr:hypothetical protein [Burkholderiales bacterium]